MDRPWKRFEREVASLIGGGRYPANSGHELDCGPDEEHPDCQFVAQAKEVSRLSLEELTQLAETAAAQGQSKGKIGVVGVKVRRGAGHPSPGLVVMTFEQFKATRGQLDIADQLIAERDRVLDALPCNAHGRCVPHALDEIARLQALERPA